MRHKSYPYYVVHKASGKVVAGAEFREDALDVSRDMPIPEAELAVLTHAGVVRRLGRVSWGYPPSMRSRRMTRSNPAPTAHALPRTIPTEWLAPQKDPNSRVESSTYPISISVSIFPAGQDTWKIVAKYETGMRELVRETQAVLTAPGVSASDVIIRVMDALERVIRANNRVSSVRLEFIASSSRKSWTASPSHSFDRSNVARLAAISAAGKGAKKAAGAAASGLARAGSHVGSNILKGGRILAEKFKASRLGR